jgi:phage protein D
LPSAVYQLSFDGTPADDAFYGLVTGIEVDEDVERDSTFTLRVTLEQDANGEWPLLADQRLALFTKVRASIGFPGGAAPEPVIEGYVTDVSVRRGADPSGDVLELRGGDLMLLMGLEDKIRAFPGTADADIAQQVLAAYGCRVDAEPTAPVHQEAETLVVQRGSDANFLRGLARRNGYEVSMHSDSAGVTCRFRPPRLDEAPQSDLALRFGPASNLLSFEVVATGTRPLAVSASQLDARTKQEQVASVGESTLEALGARRVAALVRPKLDSALTPLDEQGRMLLLAQPSADGAELDSAVRAVRDRADWLVTARGEVNSEAYGAVLRAGRLVLVKGAGRNHSGKYYVTRVSHRLDPDGSYRQTFEARRNADGLDGSERFGGGSDGGRGIAR